MENVQSGLIVGLGSAGLEILSVATWTMSDFFPPSSSIVGDSGSWLLRLTKCTCFCLDNSSGRSLLRKQWGRVSEKVYRVCG
jgi:hypothetical protein